MMRGKVRGCVLATLLGAFLALAGAYPAGWVAPLGAGQVALAQEADSTPVIDTGGQGNPTDTPGAIDNPVTENPIDINAQIVMWLSILGFLSTFAISFINRAIPGIEPDDKMKRGIVAFLFCVLVGVLDTMIRGTLNLTNATASILIVFASAIGFYNQWFKGSDFATRIEGRPVT